jgi:hypothetical protein
MLIGKALSRGLNQMSVSGGRTSDPLLLQAVGALDVEEGLDLVERRARVVVHHRLAPPAHKEGQKGG